MVHILGGCAGSAYYNYSGVRTVCRKRLAGVYSLSSRLTKASIEVAAGGGCRNSSGCADSKSLNSP